MLVMEESFAMTSFQGVTSASQTPGAWLRQYHNTEMTHHAEILPLRRDMVTLVTFVRDNKVLGTPSTGNMPLKAVREVTARFVNPPVLDRSIGERTYRLRSEDDVWSLHFLHILAEVGGLLAIAPARRWRFTTVGERFLNASPLLQVMFLFTAWWYDVNWLVAFPFEGMGDELPFLLNDVTVAYLSSLHVGKSVVFAEFADTLVEKAGLKWTPENSGYAMMRLRWSIERMVIDVLSDFGAVRRECREEPLGQRTISELSAFEVTPLGKALLDAIRTLDD